MPGPISDSYPGPMDKRPDPPRWAFPHMTDEEYADMLALEDDADNRACVIKLERDFARKHGPTEGARWKAARKHEKETP